MTMKLKVIVALDMRARAGGGGGGRHGSQVNSFDSKHVKCLS